MAPCATYVHNCTDMALNGPHNPGMNDLGFKIFVFSASALSVVLIALLIFRK